VKTQQCDDCAYGETHESHPYGFYIGGEQPTTTFECHKGHKPRFYLPRDMMDTTWGWKRKCADYKQAKP
jgi:hypothetical protein